jgi:hypothetical protein
VKVGFWNYYEELNRNNYMFLNPGTSLGDDLLRPLNDLYEYARQQNLEFMTLDMVSNFEELDAFVFMDFPNLNNSLIQRAFASAAPKYLILWESEIIKPDNWDTNNHKQFRKIFTWKDDIIDNKKYFKINYSHVFPDSINRDLTIKKRLCTLMASDKRVDHPLELYSRRLEAIRWFEKNHPEDFDLYGIGWHGYKLIGRKLSRKLDRFGSFAKLLPLRFPSYRGRVEVKRNVLEHYKFAICYENAKDISGYITEKIFDCFFAGCVPIYWGANNVEDHIPAGCFIDKRKFENYETLYAKLRYMDDKTYFEYLDNIQTYLGSTKSYEFTVDYFIRAIISGLLECVEKITTLSRVDSV